MLLVCLILLGVGRLGAQDAAPAAGQDAAQDAAQAAAPAKPEPVGSTTCSFCHPQIFEAFMRNPHSVLPTEEACASCHGPGSIHAGSMNPADIRNPAKLAPAASSEVCLTCHRNSPTQAGRLQNGHALNQVACVNCHTMHGPPEQLISKKPSVVNDKCTVCHTSVKAAFARPYTHKLLENAISCIDCHNPHNRNMAPTVRMVAAANQPACFNCHNEKRGPFLFEHAPVRTDGCTACHEPHGSSNPRMLIVNEQRVLCLQCHANVGLTAVNLGGTPSAIHDLSSGRYQKCSVCHVTVHGSNVSPDLLR